MTARPPSPLRTRLLSPQGLRSEAPRLVRESLPTSVQERLYEARFRLRWGFAPPPIWSDWSHYQRLLAVAEQKDLAAVPGDVVEIGVLLGGGTYKLCRWCALNAPNKQVVSIDIFDATVDVTLCAGGKTMAALYEEALAGRDQREVFDEVTRDCTNLTVLAEDSAKVELPCERIALAYVDGNHSAPYVRSDFELVWSKLSPGGIVGFDDYGRDIPEVTHTLHELLGEHATEVARVWVDGPTLLIERA